jgi:hypothetical protein
VGREIKTEKEWGIKMWIEEEGRRGKIFERWFYFNPSQDKHLLAGHA